MGKVIKLGISTNKHTRLVCTHPYPERCNHALLDDRICTCSTEEQCAYQEGFPHGMKFWQGVITGLAIEFAIAGMLAAGWTLW